MKKPLVPVWLEIISWLGYGGHHAYGKLYLQNYEGEAEVKWMLTERDACNLNSLEKHHGYEAGMETQRFESKEQLIRHVIRNYRKYFPTANAVFMGDPSMWGPQRCLAGPKGFKEAANALEEAYADDDGLREVILEDWDKLIAEWTEVVKVEK